MSVSQAYRFVEIPRPGEGDALAYEAAALLLQSIQGVETPTQEQILHTVASKMDEHLSFAVVNVEGSVVGTGGISLFDIDGTLVGSIVNVAVAPDERGEGLGTRIMSHLEHGAKRAGTTEIFGEPEPGSEEFYAKLGYRPARRPYMKGDGLAKPL